MLRWPGLRRLGVQPELSKRGADRGLGDAEQDLFGGEVITANQAKIPNAGAFGEFDPLPILKLIQREPFHALPERQILTQTDHVESDGLAKGKHEFWGGDSIVGGPVSVPLVVERVRCRELLRAATGVADC